MIIESLALRNFRLFEEATVDFNDRVSVIVGVNGAGKSTILDALRILLSCYVGGFDEFSVRRIRQSDIRHVTYKSGSSYENTSQPPVEIQATGSIDSDSFVWGSQKLKDSPQSASPSAFKEMTRLAAKYQDRLRKGDNSLKLPLIAYYGTGRLYKREVSKREKEKQSQSTFKRLSGYVDCLDALLTDSLLAAWFERMTIKYLQRGGDLPEFRAVRRALSEGLKTLTGFSVIEFQSNFDTHELDVIYEDDGVPTRITSSQLSDGYRVALNLLADIAYKAATLNPQLGDSVLDEVEGIVLVDEIDLHLHPKWQHKILSDLANVFPKIQFVVTTHAPSVITSVEKSQLVVVDNSQIRSLDRSFYGRDANSVLRELMNSPERPYEIEKEFHAFYSLMDEGAYDAAEKKLQGITRSIGEVDPEVAACAVRLELERIDFS